MAYKNSHFFPFKIIMVMNTSFTHFLTFKDFSEEMPERVTLLSFLMPSAIKFHMVQIIFHTLGTPKEATTGEASSFYKKSPNLHLFKIKLITLLFSFQNQNA